MVGEIGRWRMVGDDDEGCEDVVVGVDASSDEGVVPVGLDERVV